MVSASSMMIAVQGRNVLRAVQLTYNIPLEAQADFLTMARPVETNMRVAASHLAWEVHAGCEQFSHLPAGLHPAWSFTSSSFAWELRSNPCFEHGRCGGRTDDVLSHKSSPRARMNPSALCISQCDWVVEGNNIILHVFEFCALNLM